MALSVNEQKVLIAVENVSFKYGHNLILKDINLSIYKGDFLAILGPNGSGKTTLIKIILRLLKPFKGRVKIMGSSVQEFFDWGKIGYVPQKATHFDPIFPASVTEVVGMGFFKKQRFFGGNKQDKEENISQALDQVGMRNYKDRRIGKLSGGQQQKVFIARAIVNHPSILFLDEPTTGVDVKTQDKFYDMLAKLKKEKKITVVIITHETGIINKHVTQVACLNQRLVYHGDHADFCQSETFKKMLGDGHHLISHRH